MWNNEEKELIINFVQENPCRNYTSKRMIHEDLRRLTVPGKTPAQIVAQAMFMFKRVRQIYRARLRADRIPTVAGSSTYGFDRLLPLMRDSIPVLIPPTLSETTAPSDDLGQFTDQEEQPRSPVEEDTIPWQPTEVKKDRFKVVKAKIQLRRSRMEFEIRKWETELALKERMMERELALKERALALEERKLALEERKVDLGRKRLDLEL